MESVEWLKSNGFKIYGAIIDGMKGLVRALFPIPIQLCQFHQMLTVQLYQRQEPELEASRELLDLANSITKIDKDSFIKALYRFYGKYQDFSTKGHTTSASRGKHPNFCPAYRNFIVSGKD